LAAACPFVTSSSLSLSRASSMPLPLASVGGNACAAHMHSMRQCSLYCGGVPAGIEVRQQLGHARARGRHQAPHISFDDNQLTNTVVNCTLCPSTMPETIGTAALCPNRTATMAAPMHALATLQQFCKLTAALKPQCVIGNPVFGAHDQAFHCASPRHGGGGRAW
jgi:hypothetical protein